MLAATALLVYVLWTALAGVLLSFSAAGIGSALSPLATGIFALWGPLALAVVIAACLWFNFPSNRSNRMAWEITPFVAAAGFEIVAALLYILPTGHDARPPSANMALGWAMVTASYHAHAALMCVTHDAFRTEQMAVRVPRFAGERSKHV